MQLPPALRQAVEQALQGVGASALSRAAATLSQRYRSEVRDGRAHVGDELTASAYLAVRLPATYAALGAALQAAATAQPDFSPRSLLDLGAGPGTALWAAADRWPGLREAMLVESSAAMRACGERLGHPATIARTAWTTADLTAPLPSIERHDLVTLGYVLNELTPEARDRLVDRAWALAAGMLVIVEPGTSAGWARMLAARERLIRAGAHILAPCPHAVACPLATPDWCHFAQRLARSRLHRQAKDADAPFEDEKFIYLAVSRRPGLIPEARVIARPRLAGGQIRLKLCVHDGAAEERLYTRRDGAPFKVARRLDWGDAMARFCVRFVDT